MRLLILLFSCTLALTAETKTPAAKPAKAEYTIGQFNLGRSVIGSGDLEKTKGKGVVIEAWGVNCPPCIASLPHLQELSVKHKDKVLFFGAECQMSDKKAIQAVIKKAGVTYPIFSGLDKCPINFSGIPRAFVFDADGKMIYDGSPSSAAFNSAVEKAAESSKPGLPTKHTPAAKPRA